MIIFQKNYEGFESLYDLDRDILEAFDPDFNPLASGLPGEFEGTITLTMTYTQNNKG